MTDRLPAEPVRLRTPQITWREEDFGFLLYDRRRDVLFEGNRTGREILGLLERRLPPGEIARRVGSREEVARFLRFLLEGGLAEVAP